jgi:hypothetical protein
MRSKGILVVSRNIIEDIEDWLLGIGKTIFYGIFILYVDNLATQNEYYTQDDCRGRVEARRGKSHKIF